MTVPRKACSSCSRRLAEARRNAPATRRRGHPQPSAQQLAAEATRPLAAKERQSRPAKIKTAQGHLGVRANASWYAVASRDIIVMGASAGGVEAFQEIVSGLPADFPASILIVLHTSPET